jgi:Flp pilus assembly protein TadD
MKKPRKIRRLTACAAGMIGALALAGCSTMEVNSRPLDATVARPILPADEPLRKAQKHFKRGDYGLAEKHYRLAVELDPQNLDAWIGLAASYDRLRRFDLAGRAYRSAIRIGGETPVVLNNMGYSYLLRGKTAKARTTLLKAQRMDPENPAIRANLALLEKGKALHRKGA